MVAIFDARRSSFEEAITRQRANFFQALQSHEKKGSVGAKLDELKAMLPTGVDASQAAALISSLKAELARE